MTTKLNLTIEEDTAKQIKVYAQKKKVSVSKLTEQYFNSLLQQKNGKKEKSFVEKWAGIANGKLMDIDKIKEEYMKEKYGY